MASRHDNIAKVREELGALQDVGALTNRQLAMALRYVTQNEDEVAEAVDTEGVKTVVDNVIDVAMSCVGGKCD